MNFKEAFREDLEHAFFDEEEFAETHEVDGEKCAVVLVDVKRQDAKMSYGLMRSTLNPKETAINKISYIVYIQEKDVKRKLSSNAMITLDGKKYFIQDVRKTEGVYMLALGIHGV